MKTILIAATLMALWSCATRQEVQVEMVNAQVIKVDTVYRFDKNPQKQLTWLDENQIEYVTYTSLTSNFKVGSRVMVLVKR